MFAQRPFASFLSYSPRGQSEEARQSKDVVMSIKYDRGNIIEYSVKRMKEEHPSWLDDYFSDSVTVVPVPKSGLMKPNTLWVPRRICECLVQRGLAKESKELLERRVPVNKSAGSKERPTPQTHYDSLGVSRDLYEPSKITLVDDVVTRGSTLIAAHLRLEEAFPNTEIRAFALVRTISDGTMFEEILAPCQGDILWRGGNSIERKP